MNYKIILYYVDLYLNMQLQIAYLFNEFWLIYSFVEYADTFLHFIQNCIIYNDTIHKHQICYTIYLCDSDHTIFKVMWVIIRWSFDGMIYEILICTVV